MLTSSIGDTGLPLNSGFQSYGTLYSLHNIKYAISKFPNHGTITPPRAGKYVVSLSASNGAAPQVVMVVVEVDVLISGLMIQQQPEDPAVGEGVIFIVTTSDETKSLDVSTSC